MKVLNFKNDQNINCSNWHWSSNSASAYYKKASFIIIWEDYKPVQFCCTKCKNEIKENN